MLAWAILAATIAAATPTATPTSTPTPTPTSTPTATPTSTPSAADAMPRMESYQLVLLKRGPTWTPGETPELVELQRRHIGHLERMAAEGKLVLAGPFSDQQEPSLRGACIYRVASAAEARALAEQDPAVKAGRLAVEVVTWWVERGYVTFPKSPPRTP